MLTRRGFIGQLMAVIAGATLAPKGLLWQPQDDPELWPALADNAPVALEQLTRLFAQLLSKELPDARAAHYVYGDRYRLGDHLINDRGVQMVDQRNVNLALPLSVGPRGLATRCIQPAASLMADNIRHDARGRRIVMGTLDIPSGVAYAAQVADGRVNVRGVVDYCIEQDANLLRFDTLYGYERAA